MSLHPLNSVLSSMGGSGDLVGCPEADMDFTWRGRVDATAEDAPGDTEEEALAEVDISVKLRRRESDREET